MSELLPCPFCGSSEQPTVFGLKPFEWWVECSGYEGLCCKLFLSTTKEEAIKKWNTRTPSDAAVRDAKFEAVLNAARHFNLFYQVVAKDRFWELIGNVRKAVEEYDALAARTGEESK